ncbi:MAG: SRPBCC family protein [Thermodesulfobacteriota bacterium]
MAVTIEMELERVLEVNAPFDKVFDLLSDVEKSGAHFPRVEKLTSLGDGVFRWESEKVGVDKYQLQSVYACKYTNNRKEGWVKWTPVAGVGNGQVEGDWKIEALGKDRTRAKLRTKAAAEVPIPKLAKMLVAPFVKREIASATDQYLANLKKALSA